MRLSPQSARGHIRTYRARGHTVVELRGEIDIVAAAETIPVLDTVTEPTAPSVIVSLLQANFFDCSGLRLLCRARRRAEERGGQLVLVCTHPLTLRILHIVHLIAVFPVHETLDEALDRQEASAS